MRSPPTGRPLRSIPVLSKPIQIAPICSASSADTRRRPWCASTSSEQRPDSAEPYFSLGNILKELSQPDEAANAYRRALALRPDFAEAYTNLGNVLQGQEAFGEAVEAYRQALTLRPDLAEAHANMGAALESLGQLKEAIEVLPSPPSNSIRSFLLFASGSITNGGSSAIGMGLKPMKANFVL